ncbi:hypothetical protein BG005_006448, partial [Podila minutissima]
YLRGVPSLSVNHSDKIPDTFNGVDAKSLTLCKVSIPTTEDNDETSISVDIVSNNNKKLTNPKIRLSTLFPQSPDDDIYIFVQRPSDAQHPEIAALRKQLSDMQASSFSWLPLHGFQ